MRMFFAFMALSLAGCSPNKAPEIAVENGWARATVAGQDSAAAYLTIVNKGGSEDRLVSVSVPRAKMAMMHASSMDAGVMRMRAMSDGLPIPAGATVELAPNGTHIMLNGLTTPLRAGEQLPATLRFAKAGTKAITIRVEEASAR
ncbi:MAG TPA: copper chaperone PCu(A)C [Sphingomicrobium sp.]|nr:copper chaperone PCu(A)C [Sphingomicrobium sp.]